MATFDPARIRRLLRRSSPGVERPHRVDHRFEGQPGVMTIVLTEAMIARNKIIDNVLVLFLHAIMQETFDFFQQELTADICFIRRALLSWFGLEPPRPRGSLEDQLCGSILGSRTRDYISRRAFNRLALHYHGDWNLAAAASISEIHALIRGVTFAEKKAAWLKLAWENNKDKNGKISFSHVAQLPASEALRELEKNPGVKRKTSASALNFSDIGGRAFVIDTHVLRVLRRFGIAGLRTQTEHVYDKVMLASAGMTAGDLFELHWHLKRLGQQFCSHSQVSCEMCPLSTRCLRRLEPGIRIVPHVRLQEAW